MSITTGTIYMFRGTPKRGETDAVGAFRSKMAKVGAQHQFSPALMGRRVRDFEGQSTHEMCGYGFLPDLKVAKAFIDDMENSGVYDRAKEAYPDYQSSVYWPSQLPGAIDGFDPTRKSFEGGAFVTTRSIPDMENMGQMGPYVMAIKELYDRYDYRLVYTGQKILDSIGETVQRQLSIGMFPSVEQAVACHEDPAYQEVSELRAAVLTYFELTLFGPLG